MRLSELFNKVSGFLKFGRKPVEKGTPETLAEMLEFNCPHCNRLLAIDVKWRHTEVECPACNSFLVPEQAIVKNRQRERVRREEKKRTSQETVPVPPSKKPESKERAAPSAPITEISQPAKVEEKPAEQVPEPPAEKSKPKKPVFRDYPVREILPTEKGMKKSPEQVSNAEAEKPGLEEHVVSERPLAKILQPAKAKEKRHIIVGLDFGTSSTKVLYRNLEKEKVYPVEFKHSMKGYSNFMFPSIVSLMDGNLYFGTEPKDSTSRLFLSLKRCIGCQASVFSNKSCPYYEDRDRCFSLADKNGIELHVPVKYMCAWYLGYVLKHARQLIKCKYGEKYDIELIYNLGIPIDHYENQQSKKLFSDTFAVAERLSEKMEDGVSFSELCETTEYQFSHVDGIPEEQIRTYIFTETIAAVVSDVLNPSYEAEEKHAIIDVGAGTTDITIFVLPRMEGRKGTQRFCIYRAETFSIGADDIDRKILDRLDEDPRTIGKKCSSLHAIRTAKQNVGTDDSLKVVLGGKSYSLPNEEYVEIVDNIANDIYEDYREVWWKAYQKEKREKFWRGLTLFRIGGGNRIEGISKRLGKSLPLSDRFQEVIHKKLALPGDLTTNPGNGENWVKANYDLFAIAYGLTLCQTEWRADDVILSDRIKPLPRPTVIRMPDRDELYQRK